MRQEIVIANECLRGPSKGVGRTDAEELKCPTSTSRLPHYGSCSHLFTRELLASRIVFPPRTSCQRCPVLSTAPSKLTSAAVTSPATLPSTTCYVRYVLISHAWKFSSKSGLKREETSDGSLIVDADSAGRTGTLREACSSREGRSQLSDETLGIAVSEQRQRHGLTTQSSTSCGAATLVDFGWYTSALATKVRNPSLITNVPLRSQ